MTTSFPDVLDAMGRTPREFGSVHIHFEGVRVVDGRRSVATVLAQAAFTPGAPVTVAIVDEGETIASAALPSLDDGRVVRVHVPCIRRSDASELTLVVQAEEPAPKAVRVRDAWKLFDTFEIPKLSEMEPIRGSDGGGVDVASSLALSAVTAPLLGAVVIQFNTGATLAANTKTTVHRARELPALAAGVLAGIALPLERVREEVIWRPGQPVPEAPPLVPLVSHPQPARGGERRWCRSCGFEDTRREHEHARACPRCDEPWF